MRTETNHAAVLNYALVFIATVARAAEPDRTVIIHRLDRGSSGRTEVTKQYET